MSTDAKGILISYRRDESSGYAGRIADRFIETFGEHRVFHDLNSIEPGLDFAEQIQRAADSSEVLVAVIGRNWLTATDEAGQRRLENPEDYVRLEIATALKRNIRVIPVLVQGASMPSASELPSDLAPITRHNAFELHDRSWGDDIKRLVHALERVVGHGEVERDLGSPPREVGQTDNQATTNVAANAGVGSATTKWGQIGAALLVPALVNLFGEAYVAANPQLPDGTPAFEFYFPGQVYFYLAIFVAWLLSTLACGFWAGTAWRTRSLRAYLVLGATEGLLVVFIDSFVEGASIFGFLAPALIFISGILYGDRRKRKRLPSGGRDDGYARKIAEKVSGPGQEPAVSTIWMIEKLGPPSIGLVGTIIAVVFD